MLTRKQKLAARYLAGGTSRNDLIKQIPGLRLTTLNRWLGDLRFKREIARVEARYLKTIDSELITLKVAAFRVLREALEGKDFSAKQWAVSKVFQVESFKQRELGLKQEQAATNIYLGSGTAFETPEEKAAAQEYLLKVRKTGGSRYANTPGLNVRSGAAEA